MPTVLFLSPHLDDVVFSCGGLAATLAQAGWETVLVTAFTRSVLPATGFALACQLDKGLSPEADYMAIRRAEDLVAAELLGFDEVLWLDLPEAPHRGYESAPALFAGRRPGDDPALLAVLRHLAVHYAPDLVVAPQGLGNHVDHLVMIDAARGAFAAVPTLFYRDTPYAVRAPDAPPPTFVADLKDFAVAVDVGRKVAAALAYVSQVPFQFGTPAAAAATLQDFAMREGAGTPAERFRCQSWPRAMPMIWLGHATRQP